MNLFDAATKLSTDTKNEGKVRADDLALETGADKLLIGKGAKFHVFASVGSE